MVWYVYSTQNNSYLISITFRLLDTYLDTYRNDFLQNIILNSYFAPIQKKSITSANNDIEMNEAKIITRALDASLHRSTLFSILIWLHAQSRAAL